MLGELYRSAFPTTEDNSPSLELCAARRTTVWGNSRAKIRPAAWASPGEYVHQNADADYCNTPIVHDFLWKAELFHVDECLVMQDHHNEDGDHQEGKGIPYHLNNLSSDHATRTLGTATTTQPRTACPKSDVQAARAAPKALRPSR